MFSSEQGIFAQFKAESLGCSEQGDRVKNKIIGSLGNLKNSINWS